MKVQLRYLTLDSLVITEERLSEGYTHRAVCVRECEEWTIEKMSMWEVHKFGGTSVGSPDCMRKCVDIIKPVIEEGKSGRLAIVVSAMGGKPKTTDLLLDLVHSAAAAKMDEVDENIEKIKKKHQDCVAVHTYTHTHIHAYTYTYTYTYIHTHIHIGHSQGQPSNCSSHHGENRFRSQGHY